MASTTLNKLADFGITQHNSLKLEFSFHTNARSKARALRKYLLSLGYAVTADRPASDGKPLSITGWTPPIKMRADIVTAWTRQMCRKGFEYDCQFGGWGVGAGE
jgi:hypothetical protein